MAFEIKTQDRVLQELKNAYENLYGGSLSDVSGTFVGDNLAANAVEFEKAYIEMNLMMEAAFAETSWGEYLTMRAAEHGIDRKDAVQAQGTVTVTGNGVVPVGSLFATESGITFEAVKSVTIEKSGDVPVRAVDAGTSGNVAARTITKIPVTIAGISSVINSAATYDGYNAESDESLLNRLYLHVRNPITSGNANHYREWALSVGGVGTAKVVPLWNGNGTVKVIIADSDNNQASEALIKKTADYIETVRPIGATVTVVTPSIKEFSVSANVVVVKGWESMYADKLKSAIANYMQNEAFTDGKVSLAKIGKAMLDSGTISDYNKLLLDGSNANITLTTEQLPRLKDLTVTADA